MHRVEISPILAPLRSFSMALYWFRSSIYYITFTVAFGLLVDLAAYGIIVPVLPFRLASIGYHHIPQKSSLLVAAYAAGLIISSIPMSILGEVVKSRKTPLLLCLVFLAASLVLFWLSTSFPVLIISRILQGFSGTGIFTLGLALICDTVPEEKLGAVMGYVMIGWSIGSVIGPLAGGVLYDTLGYHSIFIFALILTAIDFILRFLVVDKADLERKEMSTPPDTSYRRKEGNNDLTEFSPINTDPERNQPQEAASAPRDTQESNHKKEEFQPKDKNCSSPLVTTSAVQAVWRKGNPFLPFLALFGSLRAWTLVLIIFVLGFAFGGLLDAGMTIIVHHRYGLDSKGAGFVFIAAVVPSFASSPLAGHVADKFGAKWPVVVCLVAGSPFLALMSLKGSLLNFVVWLSFTGLFIMGIAAPIMEDLSQLVKHTPGLGHAHVYGIFNMVYSVGALVGPLCVGALMQHNIEKGWMMGCLLCTALCAACVLPSWFFCGNKRQKLCSSTSATLVASSHPPSLA